MVVLTGPFRLICTAYEQDGWWAGRWQLERVTAPMGILEDGLCSQLNSSEFSAKRAALQGGLTALDQWVKADREASAWSGSPAAL